MKLQSYLLAVLLLSVFLTGCKKDGKPGSNTGNTAAMKKMLDSGLVGYYPFIGNANDVTGNGNNGTLKDFNGFEMDSLVLPALTKDKFGHSNSAYYFNGVSDWIDVSHNPILFGMTINQGEGAPIKQFSISIRFKTDTNSLYQTLVQSGDAHASAYSAQLAINGDMSLALAWEFVNPPIGSNAYFTTAANTIVPGKWYDMVLNYSNSKCSLYLNGTPVAMQNTVANSDFTTAGFFDVLRIAGTWQTLPNWFFKGTIDNIRFYNRELTDKEIQYLLLDIKYK